MTPQTGWVFLACFAITLLWGIASKLGKIADELAILRKSRTNLAGDEIPFKVWITKMPKE
jgi:hypothetical protein